MTFVYTPKEGPCPLCKGKKKVKGMQSFSFSIGPQGIDKSDIQLENPNECPHCNGSGTVNLPPYNDGSEAKISKEKVSELCSAATLLRCIGDPIHIQAVANQAAKITLPEDIVATYDAYWGDPHRDVTLGEYTRQIAQTAEELAMKLYGDLGNPIFAGARTHEKE